MKLWKRAKFYTGEGQIAGSSKNKNVIYPFLIEIKGN